MHHRLSPTSTAAAALAGLALLGPAATPASAAPAASPQAQTVFSTGKQVVAGMTITGDGRVLYVGPGSGKVFVWSPATKQISTFATVTNGRGGYGVVLSPTFRTDHFVYAYMQVGGHEKVVRWTAAKGVGTAYRVLRDVGPVGSEHTGGVLRFSPDGKKLFVMVGDGGDPASSQDPTVDHGKILRLTPLGAPVPENPGFADKAIWTTGHRNSIGMVFDPRTEHLWEGENGPECNDEINSISAGKNFGWGPAEVCDGTVAGTNQDGVAPVLPAENLQPTVAPTGMTFCDACGLPLAEGKIVYGQFKTNSLHVVTFDSTHKVIVGDDLLFQDDDRPIAVESSPADHAIWFSTAGGAVKRLTR